MCRNNPSRWWCYKYMRGNIIYNDCEMNYHWLIDSTVYCLHNLGVLSGNDQILPEINIYVKNEMQFC